MQLTTAFSVVELVLTYTRWALSWFLYYLYMFGVESKIYFGP